MLRRPLSYLLKESTMAQPTLPLLLLGLLMLLAAPHSLAQDATRISPAKVAQLQRLEPLTPDKVRIFVESGQLTEKQMRLVVQHIDKNGKLALPDFLVGEPLRSATAPPSPVRAPETVPWPSSTKAGPIPLVRRSDGSLDVVAWLQEDDARDPPPTLDPAARERLAAALKAFRGSGGGLREQLKNEVRAALPAANALIAEEFSDPVDLHDAVSLWKAVAYPGNARATGFIAAYHQRVMHRSNAVLIPHAKDVGGVQFRREQGNAVPARQYYDSRTIRELILELEKAITQCSGVRAATYMQDVWVARYRAQAPMRDSSRDKKRMVDACGGDKEGFDRGKPSTWTCSLPPHERAMIAERLAPYLRSDDGDLRDIARDGLVVVLGAGTHDKKLKDRLTDAQDDWAAFQVWLRQRCAELLAGR